MKRFLFRHASDVTTITENTVLEICSTFIHNYGLGYYVNLWRILQSRFSQYNIYLSISCGDNVGLALDAMNAGITDIRFSGSDSVLEKLRTIADQYNVQINR